MFSLCPALILAPSKHANTYGAKTYSLTFSSPSSRHPFSLRNTENYKLPLSEQIKRRWECLSGSSKSYKLFSFFTFSQCQEEYGPITLLRVTFSVWRQCLHRLYSVYHYTSPYKEAAGLGGGKKTRSPKLSVSRWKEGQRSSLNYHQLTEMNLPKGHLFVKSYSSLMGFLVIRCFKVHFSGDISKAKITNITPKHFIFNRRRHILGQNGDKAPARHWFVI